jgi:hypothetical protein
MENNNCDLSTTSGINSMVNDYTDSIDWSKTSSSERLLFSATLETLEISSLLKGESNAVEKNNIILTLLLLVSTLIFSIAKVDIVTVLAIDITILSVFTAYTSIRAWVIGKMQRKSVDNVTKVLKLLKTRYPISKENE